MKTVKTSVFEYTVSKVQGGVKLALECIQAA